jgi:SWIM zinc finger
MSKQVGVVKQSRLDKAIALANAVTMRNDKDGPFFTLPSQTNQDKVYEIRLLAQGTHSCTCPDFVYRQSDCKHIMAVRIHVKKETQRVDDEISQLVNQAARLERRQREEGV